MLARQHANLSWLPRMPNTLGVGVGINSIVMVLKKKKKEESLKQMV